MRYNPSFSHHILNKSSKDRSYSLAKISLKISSKESTPALARTSSSISLIRERRDFFWVLILSPSLEFLTIIFQKLLFNRHVKSVDKFYTFFVFYSLDNYFLCYNLYGEYGECFGGILLWLIF